MGAAGGWDGGDGVGSVGLGADLPCYRPRSCGVECFRFPEVARVLRANIRLDPTNRLDPINHPPPIERAVVVPGRKISDRIVADAERATCGCEPLLRFG